MRSMNIQLMYFNEAVAVFEEAVLVNRRTPASQVHVPRCGYCLQRVSETRLLQCAKGVFLSSGSATKKRTHSFGNFSHENRGLQAVKSQASL